MAQTIKRDKLQIDAAGRSIGRVASDVAMKLMGKHKPAFEMHRDHGDFVEVTNAAKMKVTGNKMDQKEYISYSGYPGGIKRRGLKQVMAKDPSDALRRAVKNMLPKNRLQNERMKRLTITN